MNNSKLFLVNTAVANLRKEPSPHQGGYNEDPLQETQLLFGEPLLGNQRANGWIHVHAPNQPFYSEAKGWSGYPGWVQESDVVEVYHSQADTLMVVEHGAELETEAGPLYLSVGTFLEHSDESESHFIIELPNGGKGKIEKECCRVVMEFGDDNPRSSIVDFSNEFLDMPYLWGGRSSYMPTHYPLTSVDCSGLTYLLHALIGITIPRNAHDQYLRCLKLDPADLQPGDLVFTAKRDKPGRMTHVMLYQGDGILIEASSTEAKVRTVPVQEKIGARIQNMKHGDLGPNSYVFCGSFIKE